ncbi:MAG: phosphate-starvation-inducible PsiE family protein, partial [Gammaproteobacteria bacterium]|nr:phosphate-starvation-inducible PsiE family protein [Gammaproteobacteria bacterium]
MRDPVRGVGLKLVPLVEDLGLFAVLAATVVAGAMEIWGMVSARQVSITDLLMLFIYLEVISMVEIYWQAGKLPVRMPLYIAMVALARYLMLDTGHLATLQIFAMAGAILLLAFSVLVVRYGHIRYPYPIP